MKLIRSNCSFYHFMTCQVEILTFPKRNGKCSRVCKTRDNQPKITHRLCCLNIILKKWQGSQWQSISGILFQCVFFSQPHTLCNMTSVLVLCTNQEFYSRSFCGSQGNQTFHSSLHTCILAASPSIALRKACPPNFSIIQHILSTNII